LNSSEFDSLDRLLGSQVKVKRKVKPSKAGKSTEIMNSLLPVSFVNSSVDLRSIHNFKKMLNLGRKRDEVGESKGLAGVKIESFIEIVELGSGEGLATEDSVDWELGCELIFGLESESVYTVV
jgi:hypothetical protein